MPTRRAKITVPNSEIDLSRVIEFEVLLKSVGAFWESPLPPFLRVGNFSRWSRSRGLRGVRLEKLSYKPVRVAQPASGGLESNARSNRANPGDTNNGYLCPPYLQRTAVAADPWLAAFLSARVAAAGHSGRRRRLGGHGAGGHGLFRHRRRATHHGPLHHHPAINCLRASGDIARPGGRPGHRHRPDLRPDRG